MARTVLNGHSGSGIVYKDRQHLGDLPEAPLYVEYIPKDSEYRVHVFNGEVIDVQRKIRDPDRTPTDWKVRSHQNGFIYTRNDIEGRSYKDTVPEDILVQAKRALVCSGLVFGAIDCIWSVKREKAYILEVNSAPGLEGESVNVYATAIKGYYNV
jgi:glutathione synthase/RimK-type ligase-like ATP-grasp enzyme